MTSDDTPRALVTRDLEREHSLVGTSLGCKQEHDDYPANEWNRVNRPTAGAFSRMCATGRAERSRAAWRMRLGPGLHEWPARALAEAWPHVTSELRTCVLTAQISRVRPAVSQTAPRVSAAARHFRQRVHVHSRNGCVFTFCNNTWNIK